MPEPPFQNPPPQPQRLTDWLAGLRPPWASTRRDANLSRTLYLHAGGPKAGSSALQAFLAHSAEDLAKQGVSYRVVQTVERDDQITSGNAERFYGLFHAGRATDAACAETIEGYFDGTNTAICSSEMLASLDAKSWRRIRDTCVRQGIRPAVLFFVRDVAPYLRSSYHQAIKRAGYHDSFEAFLSNAQYGHAASLRALRSVFRGDELHVLHFDSIKSHLVKSFLDAIGLGEANVDVAKGSQPVNRGLTIEEELLLREANAIGGDAYSQSMSDSMLYAFPNRKVTAGIPQSHLGMIETRHGADVRWINATFFEGRPVLAVSTAEAVGDRTASMELVADTARHLLSWALREMQVADERALQFLLSRINVQAVPPASGLDENVPSDFDPVRYLILNLDVLRNGWNAFDHYYTHGRAEGRRYRDR
jgi:hypothetical protein